MQTSRIIKGSAIILILKIVAAIFSLLMLKVVVTHVSVNESGEFIFYISVVTFMATIVRFGNDNPLIRFTAKYKKEDQNEKIAAIIWHSFLTIIRLFLLVFSVFIIYKVFFSSIDTQIYAQTTMMLSILTIAINFSIGSILQGIGKPFYAVIVKSLSLPFVVVILLVLIFILHPNVDYIYYAYFSGSIISLSLAIYFLKSMFRFEKFHNVDIQTFKSAAKTMFTAQFFQQLNIYAPLFMLKLFQFNEFIAYYGIALKLATLSSFALTSINNFIVHKFAELDINLDCNKIRDITKRVARLTWTFSISYLLVVYIAADAILSLFGIAYLKAKPALLILIIGQFINSVTGPVAYILTLSGNEKLYKNNVIISSAISIIVGVFVVPHMGLVGAAVTGALALSLSNLLSWYTLYKRFKINTMRFW